MWLRVRFQRGFYLLISQIESPLYNTTSSTADCRASTTTISTLFASHTSDWVSRSTSGTISWKQRTESCHLVVSTSDHDAPGVLTIDAGPIEVIDSDFVAYRSRPDRPLASESFLDSSSSTPSTTSSDAGDPFLPIDDCLDAVFDKRFINTHSLGIIPAALALSFKSVVSPGSSRIALPSLPLIPKPQESTSISSEEVAAPHIYLHAWAERMASCSQIVSHDAATRLMTQDDNLGVPTSFKSTPIASPVIDAPKRLARLQIELNDLIQDWSDDLKSRASLAQILGDRFDWHCLFDEKLPVALETNLPIFDLRLDEFEQLSAAMEEGIIDPVVESRKMQVSLAKREGESELKAARKRLGAGWEEEHLRGDAKSLGVWEVASFFARAT